MKILAFTIADERNLPYAQMMKNSFHHFHPDIELKIIGPEEIAAVGDPQVFYRATPLWGRMFLEDYDLVVKIDADSVITGDLSHIFNDDMYDLGTVLNWNRVDQPRYPFPLSVWDIPIQHYYNCGFVAMRSRELVEHWWQLCLKPSFNNYRFREQDLLNIIAHYGNYQVKCFDHSDNWHGLISSGEWLNFKLRGKTLYLPVVNNYPETDKVIKVVHYAGGNVSQKMNFDLNFKPTIAKHLKELVRGKNE